MIVLESASENSYVEFQSLLLMWMFFHCRPDEQGRPLCASDTVEEQCLCKRNFDGQFCEKCATGYYNFPDCTRK